MEWVRWHLFEGPECRVTDVITTTPIYPLEAERFYNENYHLVDIKEMADALKSMSKNGWKRVLFMLDEADRVFPARGFGAKEQWEALLNLWQLSKNGCQMYGTTHVEGNDKILRMASDAYYSPSYNRADDSVLIFYKNFTYGWPAQWYRIPKISKVYGLYDDQFVVT